MEQVLPQMALKTPLNHLNHQVLQPVQAVRVVRVAANLQPVLQKKRPQVPRPLCRVL